MAEAKNTAAAEEAARAAGPQHSYVMALPNSLQVVDPEKGEPPAKPVDKIKAGDVEIEVVDGFAVLDRGVVVTAADGFRESDLAFLVTLGRAGISA